MLSSLASQLGACGAFTATRATASTASSARSIVRGDRIDFIQVAARGRWPRSWPAATPSSRGEVGVCLATSGPGRDPPAERPVRREGSIISRWSRSSARSRAPRSAADYQQEVDLASLFKDVAREYVQMATTPAQMRHRRRPRVPHRARASALPTCIIVPHDLQESRRTRRRRTSTAPSHSGVGYSRAARRARRRRPASAPPTCSTRASASPCSSAPARCDATDEVIAVADTPRRGRRQGAARQGRAARRPAVRHRLASASSARSRATR